MLMKETRKIKYCIGLNGKSGNLETLLAKRGADIYEVYAPCPSDIAPTGRRVEVQMTLKELKRQIRLAHNHGVGYNVLMNASCFGGAEFGQAYRNKISDFVKKIDGLGADSTTVMNPFIIDLVRQSSRRIKIIAGSFAEIVEPVKIERFRSRGANRIVLHQNVYRNFEMLKRIRKYTDLELEIIPNQGCMNQCECFITHINIVAHSSVATEREIKKFGDFDFPIKRCRMIRQKDPVEFLMSCFIRPEDLGIYEKLGFNIFKLAGRRSSTEWMLNTLDAYVKREYAGNLFDLSSHVGENPKVCHLPNPVLNGWYQYMGSNSEHMDFRKKAIEFCLRKKIYKYFPEWKRK